MTKNEKEKLAYVLQLITSWKTHCDYRAESDLQEACQLLGEVLHSVTDNQERKDGG